MSSGLVLDVKDLSVHYQNTDICIQNINFSISHGQVLGILGESGSGKSTVCNAILGLLDTNTTKVKGSVALLDKEILSLPWDKRERINGKDIGVVMQNPMTAFDPCMRIRGHFSETLKTHLMCSKRDAVLYGLDVLNKVGLRDGKRIMASYPFQLSGGMLQRVMTALAIALNPVLIIADEPTTALDYGSRRIVLELLTFVMREYRPAMLLVSHDMEVISALADDIAVMKDGQVVEQGSFCTIRDQPRHEYTKELLNAARMLEVM